MTTTVEVDEETLDILKDARDTIQKRLNIKMRMPDIMKHLINSKEDIVDIVCQSIKDQMNKN